MAWRSGFIAILISFVLFALFFHPVFAGTTPTQLIIAPTQAFADGSSVSTVKITLEDSNNTGVGGDAVTINSTDSTVRFNSNTTIQTNLDGSGNFTFSMTSTDAGDVNLTVQDTTTNNTFTGTVHFDTPNGPSSTPTPTPTPQPGVCTDASPGSTVSLTSAESAGAHAVLLTWADAHDPVTFYQLSYGLSSGNYIYGAPNVGGQGTTSYTVGGLTTGKTYYFIVRAVNGCTPGNASNEVSGIAGASPTPTPGTTDSSNDTFTQSDVVPTDTPEIPTDTPSQAADVITAPTPVETNGSNTFMNHIMLGATAVGVVCAVAGAVIYLRMKKHRL